MAPGVSLPTFAPLDAIDWSAPWLAPWRGLGRPVAQQVQGGCPVAQALQAAAPAAAAPVAFAPQAELPSGVAYEQYIRNTRRVPTRDHLHDFFNGLVWLPCPQTKRRLHALPAGALAADGVRAVRGPLRDALTVFDENGALLQAPDVLWNALRARDWLRLFIDLRPLWSEARLVLFGHALMEKLVTPRKPMVAHVYCAPKAIDLIAMEALSGLDTWLAQAVHPAAWAAKPFTPLPVLGVPGWWPANEVPAFYDDALVFRPPRAVPAP